MFDTLDALKASLSVALMPFTGSGGAVPLILVTSTAGPRCSLRYITLGVDFDSRSTLGVDFESKSNGQGKAGNSRSSGALARAVSAARGKYLDSGSMPSCSRPGVETMTSADSCSSLLYVKRTGTPSTSYSPGAM